MGYGTLLMKLIVMASSPRGWSVLREAAKGGSLARLHTFKVLEMEFHSHPLPSVWSKLFHVADAALFFFFFLNINGHWYMENQEEPIRNISRTFTERQTLNPSLSSDEA